MTAAVMLPNESRRRFLNLGPVPGGETPYLIRQNYSLEDLAALHERDRAKPFAKPTAAASPALPSRNRS